MNMRQGNGSVGSKLEASPFDIGFLVGLLVGEGHFGGDGRQPQVTLRMHTDHENLFAWLTRVFPGGRLFGPYDHGGRRYYQWMARGTFLRDTLIPILDAHLRPQHSQRVYGRYRGMKERYGLDLDRSAWAMDGLPAGRGAPVGN